MTSTGPVTIRRLGADIGKGAHACPRLETCVCPRGCCRAGPQRRHRRCPRNCRRDARCPDALHGDGIEAGHFSHLHERRLECGEPLHGRVRGACARPWRLSGSLHGHDRAAEAAVVDAAAARFWLSHHPRRRRRRRARIPYLVAMRSADTPCGRKYSVTAIVGSTAQAPPDTRWADVHYRFRRRRRSPCPPSGHLRRGEVDRVEAGKRRSG